MQLQKLTLYTSNLEKSIEFYGHTLKLPLLIKSLQSATFRVGRTRLTFTRKENCKPYHFAINVPSNKEHDVLAWLRDKVKLISVNDSELVENEKWNSRSVYFYDHDNNLVEFIARKNLGFTESLPFIPTQILGVSEIGMAVSNIDETYNKLNEVFDLPVFDSENADFCAAGDELGMFMIVNKAKHGWFPNNDTARTADFILQQDDKTIKFINGEVLVS